MVTIVNVATPSKLKRGQEIIFLSWQEKIDNILEENHKENPSKLTYYRAVQNMLYGTINDRNFKTFKSVVEEYARYYMYKRVRAFKVELEDCIQECWILLYEMLKGICEDIKTLKTVKKYPVYNLPIVYIFKTIVESRTSDMLRSFNRDKRILSCSNYFKKGQAIIRIDSIDRLKELQDFDIEDKTAFKAFENIEQRTDKMATHNAIKLTSEAIANEFVRECNIAGIALTPRERTILLRILELGESYKTLSVRGFAEVCSMNQTTMRRERKSLFEKLNIVGIPNKLKSILTAS